MMIQKTAGRAILEQLAAEQRQVFAAWRGLILLRRATFALPKLHRRWDKLPKDTSDLLPYFSEMERREDITRIRHVSSVYQITTPFAAMRPLDEVEVLQEAHPYSALSHASALRFHERTNDLEKRIMMTVPAKPPPGIFPSGTMIEDWEGITLPSGSKPQTVFDRPVKWTQVTNLRFFGVSEYRRFGYPLRVTDVERTLLDGLRDPDLCGGLQNVLQAWVLSYDSLNIDTVFEYVERFDIQVLTQRTGFVLEALGLRNPRLETWKSKAVRGGAYKLLSTAPYTQPGSEPTWSEEWKLSVNAPIDILEV